ncbi:epoxide hydrolase [Geodermatophilus sp. Leaf369]|uniref:epoxide hydrolase family protein n=1 Tax=Geodermatophilus sp. Leaf369 TaxID=1736354 RepID=UPI0006F48F16|nr:epoxide hydrolase family protein [Geodermatophilus sp. Leaf369]KQS56891.1 epoxide hydrolase [Geodermatophilus sp. Leaf369]
MADTDVHPFTVDIPQAELDDLRDRLARTRWPADQQLEGERGIPLELTKRLAAHMAGEWDWREHEAALNAHDQVTTTIDGTTVHALHVRAADPDAPVVVLLHGWPGSVVEFQQVIGPLAETMHVVVPSLPGYGFSGPTPTGGWTSQRMAAAIAELMARLGYGSYVAHGGDWGSRVARDLAVVDAAHVAGIHVTMTMGLTDESDQRAADRATTYAKELSGYNKTQATKPLSLAPALTDSPAGQLAWIAERFRDWTDPASDVLGPQALGQVLANVAVYWFTGTAGSSSQLYWERREHPGDEWSATVPTGVCVLPHDIHLPSRSAVEAATTLVHWTELPRGGHFPGIEVPELLVKDIRTFVERVVR